MLSKISASFSGGMLGCSSAMDGTSVRPSRKGSQPRLLMKVAKCLALVPSRFCFSSDSQATYWVRPARQASRSSGESFSQALWASALVEFGDAIGR